MSYALKPTLLLFSLLSIVLLITTCRKTDDDLSLIVEDPPEEEVICGDMPLLGDTTDACIIGTYLDHYTYIFRGPYRKRIDVDGDGVSDLEIHGEDSSYGIAGPSKNELYIRLLDPEYSISSIPVVHDYCKLLRQAGTNPDGSPHYYTIDQGACDYFTATELAEADSVAVITFMGDMVQAHHEGEVMTADTTWSTNEILLSDSPEVGTEFPFEQDAYILVKREHDGLIHYGWIQLELSLAYGVYITIKRTAWWPEN